MSVHRSGTWMGDSYHGNMIQPSCVPAHEGPLYLWCTSQCCGIVVLFNNTWHVAVWIKRPKHHLDKQCCIQFSFRTLQAAKPVSPKLRVWHATALKVQPQPITKFANPSPDTGSQHGFGVSFTRVQHKGVPHRLKVQARSTVVGAGVI